MAALSCELDRLLRCCEPAIIALSSFYLGYKFGYLRAENEYIWKAYHNVLVSSEPINYGASKK
jgi:hypothetical protein